LRAGVGNRIEKVVDLDGDGEDPAVTTKFALEGWNPAKSASPVGNENWDIWADLDVGGSLTTRYMRGDAVDQIFAELGAGGPLWTLTDHLGSVRDLVDQSGAVQDTIAYDGFGNILSESNDEVGGRFKYTAREFDVETGLQYNRARYYDAATGRWISQDPMGFDAGDSNLYRYVNNRKPSSPIPWTKIIMLPLGSIPAMGKSYARRIE
jgi:RHS repeat-associated protein